MVTALIAGLSPGTSPPPVRIPITPDFFVLIDPPTNFRVWIYWSILQPSAQSRGYYLAYNGGEKVNLFMLK
jgi:hypothetical protein